MAGNSANEAVIKFANITSYFIGETRFKENVGYPYYILILNIYLGTTK
jgi:hypothetical protein